MPDTQLSTTAPAWSQAELLRLMDARATETGRFTTPAHGPTPRDVIEAGQILGSTVVAAAKAVPGQRVVSASMIFSRVAQHTSGLEIEVDVLRSGRTLSTARTQVYQHDTMRSAGIVLLDTGAPDLIRGAVPMPDVTPPEDVAPLAIPGTGVDGRDIRVVGGYDLSDTVGPPELFVWTKFRDAPEQEYLHQALLTQSTTHWTVAAALRPHPGFSEGQAHSAISTGITMTTITFHDEADVSQWLLYVVRATYAGRGHAQSDGHIYSREGRLLASFGVHAMVRGFGTQGAPDGVTSSTLL